MELTDWREIINDIESALAFREESYELFGDKPFRMHVKASKFVFDEMYQMQGMEPRECCKWFLERAEMDGEIDEYKISVTISAYAEIMLRNA